MLENICKNCFSQNTGIPCSKCGYNGAENENKEILTVGTILNGKYIVGKCLGRGGFGITYLAFDLNLYTKVCIKEYFPGSISTRSRDTSKIVPYSGESGTHYVTGRNRFVDEARALAKFNKLECTVVIHDFFSENNTAYIVMEYLEGMDISALIKSKPNKRLTCDETMYIIKPLLTTLKRVHSAGLIHRDISPDNIFITTDKTIKLLDFGSARYSFAEQSQSLSVILKHGYAPPEQYSSRGKQGPWTDIYSLCATMYKCITGTTPVDSIEQMTVETLKPITSYGINIPKNIENTITNGLALNYKDRFQNIQEMENCLYEDAKVITPPVSTSEYKRPNEEYHNNNRQRANNSNPSNRQTGNSDYYNNSYNTNNYSVPKKISPQRQRELEKENELFTRYNSGMNLLAANKFTDAYKVLSKLGDYKHSARYAQTAAEKYKLLSKGNVFLLLAGFIVFGLLLVNEDITFSFAAITYSVAILLLEFSRSSVFEICRAKNNNIFPFLLLLPTFLWQWNKLAVDELNGLHIPLTIAFVGILTFITFGIKDRKNKKYLQIFFLFISIAANLFFVLSIS